MSSFKKLTQKGFLSTHVLIPLVAVVVVVGGVGAYVMLRNSRAATPSAVGYNCGDMWRGGTVYASVVGTQSKFKAARDSDSIRNIASKLCAKGFLSKGEAAPIMKYGNYTSGLQNAYKYWQQGLGYRGSAADGVPGSASLSKLGLKPSGF